MTSARASWHWRVEADVEVGAVDEAASLRELDELRGLLRVDREGLLADDVLARLQCRPRLRVVELVRRRQMNDVDAIVGEHLLEAVVRLGKRDRPALGARPLRRGADDAEDLYAESAQCVDVHDADEAGSHHRRTQIRQVTHRMPIVRGRAPRL